jgi:microcompartment protein CcmK/EutM
MITGLVSGTMHATIQHPFYAGKKLLVVDKTDTRGQPTGDYVIAVDTVDAGVGDAVLIVDEGNGARQIIGDPTAPIRSIIVGIVDHMDVEVSP